MQQHPAYAAACALWERKTCWHVLGPADAPLATALVLQRHWPGLGQVALVSRGPVWSPGLGLAERFGATRKLIADLRKTHAVVIATPDPVAGNGAQPAFDPLCGAGLLPLVTPMTVARLDLTGGQAERRRRLHGKWRNRLVRSGGSDLWVEVTEMPADPEHWLLLAEASQARSRGYRRLPPAFAAAWAGANRNAAPLFVAWRETQAVAAMLFLRHGESASYHIGWSNAEGRSAGAHNLLMWYAIEWLSANGHSVLELDLIDTISSPGLARFKLGTGAKPQRLGQTWIAAPGTGLLARVLGHMKKPASDMRGQVI